MWFRSVFALWRSGCTASRRSQLARSRHARLTLERLEDRTLPSSYTAGSVSDLIADINAANQVGGANTITLVAGKTFSLTAVNNTTDGATGLPIIAANDNLTILGNGDTIQRSTAKSTPAFRLFDVAVGASLTLQNLTAQNGLAPEILTPQNFYAAQGGAMNNHGALILDGVIVQNSSVSSSQFAEGGGIYSSGALTLEGGTTVQNNVAVGAAGDTNTGGGRALGGGVSVAGGTALLSNVSLASNTAQGGNGGQGTPVCSMGYCRPGIGGPGGNGLGGGLYVAGGTVSLTGARVEANSALGGHGGNAPGGTKGPDGLGEGGGLYIDALATVGLDAFTVANVLRNKASASDNDIYGSYTLLP